MPNLSCLLQYRVQKSKGSQELKNAETPKKSRLLLDFSFLLNKHSKHKCNTLILLITVLFIIYHIHSYIIGLILEMIKPRRFDIRSLQFNYILYQTTNPTHQIYIVALVVIHLHVQHSLHLLSDVHPNGVL